MVNYEAMGLRIKLKRKQRRLTQQALAKAINITPSYYGNIEHGIRIPSVDTLVAIANALQSSTDFFLADSLDAVHSKYSPADIRRMARSFLDEVEDLVYEETEEETPDGIIYEDQ